MPSMSLSSSLGLLRPHPPPPPPHQQQQCDDGGAHNKNTINNSSNTPMHRRRVAAQRRSAFDEVHEGDDDSEPDYGPVSSSDPPLPSPQQPRRVVNGGASAIEALFLMGRGSASTTGAGAGAGAGGNVSPSSSTAMHPPPSPRRGHSLQQRLLDGDAEGVMMSASGGGAASAATTPRKNRLGLGEGTGRVERGIVGVGTHLSHLHHQVGGGGGGAQRNPYLYYSANNNTNASTNGNGLGPSSPCTRNGRSKRLSGSVAGGGAPSASPPLLQKPWVSASSSANLQSASSKSSAFPPLQVTKRSHPVVLAQVHGEQHNAIKATQAQLVDEISAYVASRKATEAAHQATIQHHFEGLRLHAETAETIVFSIQQMGRMLDTLGEQTTVDPYKEPLETLTAQKRRVDEDEDEEVGEVLGLRAAAAACATQDFDTMSVEDYAEEPPLPSSTLVDGADAVQQTNNSAAHRSNRGRAGSASTAGGGGSPTPPPQQQQQHHSRSSVAPSTTTHHGGPHQSSASTAEGGANEDGEGPAASIASIAGHRGGGAGDVTATATASASSQRALRAGSSSSPPSSVVGGRGSRSGGGVEDPTTTSHTMRVLTDGLLASLRKAHYSLFMVRRLTADNPQWFNSAIVSNRINTHCIRANYHARRVHSWSTLLRSNAFVLSSATNHSTAAATRDILEANKIFGNLQQHAAVLEKRRDQQVRKAFDVTAAIARLRTEHTDTDQRLMASQHIFSDPDVAETLHLLQLLSPIERLRAPIHEVRQWLGVQDAVGKASCSTANNQSSMRPAANRRVSMLQGGGPLGVGHAAVAPPPPPSSSHLSSSPPSSLATTTAVVVGGDAPK